jgi:hypothetical protein
MALQKPYNLSISGKTIDATEDNKFTWSVSGDVQTSYKVDIYNNSTNVIAHTSGIVTSYSLTYTIPKNVLTNGNEYRVIVTIYNISNASQSSDAVIFQTSGRPVVTVDTIGTVSNFSNTFTASFTQSESVPLQSWNVNLYNSDKELIDHSDIMIELPMEYLFSNLETEKSYFIEFQVTSEKGLIGTTGLVAFDCFYFRPKQNLNLISKNIENAGIELSWFIRQILGKSNDSYNWVNNDHVNIRDGGKIWFDEGFSIDQDFSLKVWLQGVENNVPLLTLTGENGKIVVTYNPILEAFVLTKTTEVTSDSFESNKIVEYTFISPYQIIELTGDKTVLLIQQIDSDIYIEVTMYD